MGSVVLWFTIATNIPTFSPRNTVVLRVKCGNGPALAPSAFSFDQKGSRFVYAVHLLSVHNFSYISPLFSLMFFIPIRPMSFNGC